MELKPALIYEEQLQKLKKDHHLTILNDEKALQILKTVNYYRLSGYGIGLKQRDNKEWYQDGVSLDQIYDIYCFDSLFKSALIHIIEQIEIQLRTQIAYQLSINYGAEAHMDFQNFRSKKNKDGIEIHQMIVEAFRTECKRQQNIPFVKHHIINYHGHFPAWVAVELFTFGNLCSMFDIMRQEDRIAIANLYHTQPEHLESWILSLVEVRNICAHYGRLYNMPLKQSPFLYKEHRKYRNQKQNKIFPVILVIKRILNSNSEWNHFYQIIVALMEQYDDAIQLSFMGFPDDWKEILEQ